MENVQAKGVNFLYSREYIRDIYGSDIWERVITSLPESDKAVWTDTLLSNSYYPFSSFSRMMLRLPQEVGSNSDAEIARIYEYIADKSLNNIYKLFFRFTNPSFVLKNYPALWKRFFSSGTVNVPTAGSGYAVLEFDLPRIFLDWLPPACLGYSRKAVEMSGGRDLIMNELNMKSKLNGTFHRSYELRWSE